MAKKVPPNTLCGYCLKCWATEYDHLIPKSYKKDNSKSNLFPSCRRCNAILGNKIFDSIEDKINYIRKKLKLPLVYNQEDNYKHFSDPLLELEQISENSFKNIVINLELPRVLKIKIYENKRYKQCLKCNKFFKCKFFSSICNHCKKVANHSI